MKDRPPIKTAEQLIKEYEHAKAVAEMRWLTINASESVRAALKQRSLIWERLFPSQGLGSRPS